MQHFKWWRRLYLFDYSLTRHALGFLFVIYFSSLTEIFSIADELKKAIKEVICDNDEDHPEFEYAILSITIEESLER